MTMTFDLSETLDILSRTPTVVDTLLRGTSESWHAVNEGPDTWSAFDVVGHLIHGEETDWVPRARIILEHGADRPFEIVRNWHLTDAQLALPGRHPELGSVSLRELLATWAVHDLNHIAQIVRVMAKRYTEEVGAWRAYLSILDR
jgi:hypothetical protein